LIEVSVLVKISVIGSYREDECEEFKCDKNTFFEKSEALGKCLADNKYTLIIGWSNDYLKNQVIINEKTMRMKYNFEDTADYNVMRGYIINQGPKIVIYASPKLIELFRLYLEILKIYEYDKFKIQRLSDVLLSPDLFIEGKKQKLEFLDKSLKCRINNLDQNNDVGAGRQNHIEKTYLGYLLSRADGLIVKKIIYSTSIIEIKTELPVNEFRSEILKNFIIPNSDAVFMVGGGKATNFAAVEAITEKKMIIPFPEFGGQALDYLRRLKGSRKNDTTNGITSGYHEYYNRFFPSLENITESTKIEYSKKFCLLIDKTIKNIPFKKDFNYFFNGPQLVAAYAFFFGILTPILSLIFGLLYGWFGAIIISLPFAFFSIWFLKAMKLKSRTEKM
jgi:hypothetical protein